MKEYDFVRTTKEIRTIGGVAIPKGVMGMVINPANEKDWIDIAFVFKVKRNDVLVVSDEYVEMTIRRVEEVSEE